MKHSIIQALSSYEVQWDEQMRAAVEAYCQPENIQRIMAAEVSQVINGVIRDEIERFYRLGPGRRAIAEAVNDRLSANGIA